MMRILHLALSLALASGASIPPAEKAVQPESPQLSAAAERQPDPDRTYTPRWGCPKVEEVGFVISTKTYAAEWGATIKIDGEEKTLVREGSLSDNSTYIYYVGCFDWGKTVSLVAYDSYGDGWHGGFVQLTLGDQPAGQQMGTDFTGKSKTYTFTTPQGYIPGSVFPIPTPVPTPEPLPPGSMLCPGKIAAHYCDCDGDCAAPNGYCACPGAKEPSCCGSAHGGPAPTPQPTPQPTPAPQTELENGAWPAVLMVGDDESDEEPPGPYPDKH